MESTSLWKDPDARATAGTDHPAGDIDLGEARGGTDLGARTEFLVSLGCCNGFTHAPQWPCLTVPSMPTGCPSLPKRPE